MNFGIEQVYLFCFFVGLFFAIVTGLLAGVFGGDDGGGHATSGDNLDHGFGGHDHAHMPSDGVVHFSPLSPVVIAMFVTSFGGAGVILHQTFHAPALISLPLSSIVGLAMAAVTFYAFFKLFTLTQGSSHPSQDEMVGLEAEVITPIPKGGMGEIAYVVRDSRYTAPARCQNGAGVARASSVRIERIVGGVFVVKPTVEEELEKI